MRQILVRGSPTHPGAQLGSSVLLKLQSPDGRVTSVGSNRLSYVNIPFDLKRLDEFENDFHVSFGLAKEAAQLGILLVGAYLEEGNIRVLLGCILEGPVFLHDQDPLLVMSFTERVHLRAAEAFGTQLNKPIRTKPLKIARKKK